MTDIKKLNEDYYLNFKDRKSRDIDANSKYNNFVTLTNGLVFKNILEIGAGEGAFLEKASKLNIELYGIDISSEAKKLCAMRKIPNLKEYNIYDGNIIPYQNKKFDICVLSHVLEHVENERVLLYEAIRVSKKIFIEVPCELKFRMRDFAFYNKYTHINFYTPFSVRLLLESINLKIESIKVINYGLDYYVSIHQNNYMKGFIHKKLKDIILRITPNFAPYLFTYNCCILCKK